MNRTTILPSIKKTQYDELMEKAIKEAEIVNVSIDTTLTGVILGIIQKGIRSAAAEIEKADNRLVVIDGMIYLKIKYIQYHLEGYEKMSTKQIGKELTTLHFSNKLLVYDEEKKRHRVWGISKEIFDKFWSEQV